MPSPEYGAAGPVPGCHRPAATGEFPIPICVTMALRLLARAALPILCTLLAACGSSGGTSGHAPGIAAQTTVGPSQSEADFRRVASRVATTAEEFCAEQMDLADLGSCRFSFALADDPKAPPNAFQSRDADGRPLITMTSSLLAQLRNDHEIATVLSHEAAHHVAGHIPQVSQGDRRALSDAFLPEAGDLDRNGGGYSGMAGSRVRALEIEADWIGAFIAEGSGYQPETGAGILRRAADKPASRRVSQTSSHPAPLRRLQIISAAAVEIRRQRSAGLTPRPEKAPGPLP